MNYRASKISTVNLSSDQTFGAGETFTVFGILVANAATQAAEVEFTDGSGNVEFTVICPPCDSKPIPIEFVADGGLSVTGLSSTLVKVTIFHSHGG